MTKAEEIYEGFVEYERCNVSDRLKTSIIGAINEALTIPVVVGRSGQLCRHENIGAANAVKMYCKDCEKWVDNE